MPGHYFKIQQITEQELARRRAETTLKRTGDKSFERRLMKRVIICHSANEETRFKSFAAGVRNPKRY